MGSPDGNKSWLKKRLDRIKNWLKEVPEKLAWKLGTSPYALFLPILLLVVGMLTLFTYPQIFTKPAIVDLHLPSEKAIPQAIPSGEIDEDNPRWLFRYGSTGTEFRAGIPYWIFRVMPRIFLETFEGRAPSTISLTQGRTSFVFSFLS